MLGEHKLWNKATFLLFVFLHEFGLVSVQRFCPCPACWPFTRMPGRHLAFSIFSLKFIIYSPGVLSEAWSQPWHSLLKSPLSHIDQPPVCFHIVLSPNQHSCCTCQSSSDGISSVECPSPHKQPTWQTATANNLAYKLLISFTEHKTFFSAWNMTLQDIQVNQTGYMLKTLVTRVL